MSGRTVLVTGTGPASLGLETARQLRDLGHRVLVTTRRDPVDGFEWHPLDLTSAASVAALAAWVASVTDRLDVLLNNAGIHLDLRSRWTEPQLVDGHEIHWRTNYLGTAQLTRLLLPLLLETARTTGDARVVHVVSKLHQRGTNTALFDGVVPYDSWAAYGTSKLALVHDARSLTERYGDRGLRAYSLHPGAVLTRVADRGLETSPVLARLRKLGRPLEKRFLLSPEQGARTSVMCATEPDLPPGYYVNRREAQPSPAADDAAVRERLWTETADRLGRLG